MLLLESGWVSAWNKESAWGTLGGALCNGEQPCQTLSIPVIIVALLITMQSISDNAIAPVEIDSDSEGDHPILPLRRKKRKAAGLNMPG